MSQGVRTTSKIASEPLCGGGPLLRGRGGQAGKLAPVGGEELDLAAAEEEGRDNDVAVERTLGVDLHLSRRLAERGKHLMGSIGDDAVDDVGVAVVVDAVVHGGCCEEGELGSDKLLMLLLLVL